MQDDQPLTSGNKWGVLICVLLGSFTVIFNNNMLNVSIPYFMNLFGLRAVEAQWIVLGSMTPMMITMPITGYLSDVWGKKRVYLTGMFLFMTGSVLGATAWDFYSIVGFRVLQGIGAGLVMPLGISILFQYFPKSERGVAVGISGVATMLAPAVGPAIGGVILEFSSWHTLFVVNIPTGLLCVAAAAYFIKESGERRRVRFDSRGFLYIAAGIASLILGVNRLSYGWESGGWFMLLLIGMGIAGLLLFIRHELRTDSPLIDLRIFKYPVFTVSTLIGATAIANMFAGILLIPLLLQEVLNYSVLTTGLILLPQALTMALAMTVGGRIVDRHGSYFLLLSGLILVGAMSVVVGLAAGRSSLAWLVLLLGVRGLGVGAIHTPATTAGLNALPAAQVSRAMSLTNLMSLLVSSMVLVVLSFYFEASRSYFAAHMSLQEAGMLSIRQLLVGTGAMVVLVLPVAVKMLGRERKPVRKEVGLD